jgi:hypothetical protein
MIADTSTETVKLTLTRRIDTLVSDKNINASLFNMFFDFIIYRTRSDIESYLAALLPAMEPPEKYILSTIVVRKKNMFESLIRSRKFGFDETSVCEFAGASQPPIADFIVDNRFKPVECLNDIFHFAYRKEFETLTIYEKIRQLIMNVDIQFLVEHAIEQQRGQIMYLDELLPYAKTGTRSAARCVPTENSTTLIVTGTA